MAFPYEVVWVFGGSQGIGRAVGEACAARGARVALFARGSETLEAAAREIAARGRAEVRGFVADVEQPEAVSSAAAAAREALGQPDLVVCCAGRARPGRFHELPVEALRATLRANLEGTWNVAQEAVQQLAERGGTLVTTASLAGLLPIYGFSDYAASKAGVIALSQVLRQELDAQGIDVRVLCPPDVDTPGLAAENEAKPEETLWLSETGSLLRAEEVATALLRALRGRNFLIVPGRSARALALAQRLTPGLVERIVRRQLRRMRRGGPNPEQELR